LIRERVRIPASLGALAGELAYPPGDTHFAVVMVNPHPHMGGHTGNNLMVRLGEVLAGDGGVVLSFDYSGVGESDGPRIDVAESMSQFWQTGVAPEDPRMVEDTRRAVAWMAQAVRLPLLLAGYSFGAHAVTMSLTDDRGAVILISPTIRQHDFTRLRERRIAKLVVHSDNDFATPKAELEAWLAELSPPLETHCVPGGDHFFRGQEDAVAGACLAFARGLEGVTAT